ncbi:unnamed protein product [Microthlaspi erraticum]|uniref:Uncharacterized protein n=1 Tax=Microthlaspi erraticum TaxID=1685480 RepID=A0A6D2KI03_9BRAS|nr:unnamed protein product [Microthlaspi erraticum]
MPGGGAFSDFIFILKKMNQRTEARGQPVSGAGFAEDERRLVGITSGRRSLSESSGFIGEDAREMQGFSLIRI